MFLKRILPVALAFGTAWAARGQLGHEYGAAMAGGIGVLTLIAISGRADWIRRLPVIVAMGAIGWGYTAIASYGKVVGYGHMADYINTGYGLLMLLVLGALYGFIGGGLTGLTLEASDKQKPDWAAVITQMIAGGGVPEQDLPDVFFSNYGFGWSLVSYRGHYRVEHGGNIEVSAASGGGAAFTVTLPLEAGPESPASNH